MHRRRNLLALAAAMLAAAAVALACAVAPLSAQADDDTTTATAITSTGGELSSGSYVLEEDVTLTTNLTVLEGATVTIDLNGHTLTGKTKSSTTSAITVNGTLTITDSSTDGSGVITNGSNRGTYSSSKYYGAGVYVAEGGSLTLEAGAISGSGSTSKSYGGGVYVAAGATFTMSGGSVSGNTANYGGGVYVAAGAEFTMSGGSVSGNTAGYGGGVYVASGGTVTMSGSSAISDNKATSGAGGGAFLQSSVTFTMSGSSAVSGNTAASYGGGISCKASGAVITISDSSAISDNKATSGDGGGIYLYGENTLTISGGSIEGNTATDDSTTQGGGIYAGGSVTLTISDGSISENTVVSTSSTCYGGGVYMGSGTFTMTGGEVVGNKAVARNEDATEEGDSDCSYGGGISFGGSCTATISGGTICGNTANRGGGICVYPASLTLEGGTICGNTASIYGGGVYTQGSKSSFVMKGGSVCDNTAAKSGGGICLFGGGDDSNVIYAGTITGNVTTAGHGGGIYVNSGHTVTLYNVVITENTASILGGGIWACNTGGIEVYVTEGGAVYGNDATGTDGKTSSQAGDDIASVTKSDEVSYILTLASRILGGGAAAWYEDGAVDASTNYTTGYADTSASRYGEDSEEVENPEETSDSYALKDVATGTALAVAEATTVISGNSAPRGGGIGANGNVIIGDSTAETTSVTVTKTWDDSDDADGIRPDSVTVCLYNTVTSTDEDGNEVETAYLIDTAVLSADNGWTCTFDELPVDEDYSYSVEEEVPAGYEATYETVENEDGTTTVAITNTHEHVTVDVTVSKVWDDGDDADELRPDSVTVSLYADGEATGLTVELSEDNDWTATFEGLAAYSYDDDCVATEVSYTVEEVAVDGYSASLTGVSFSLGTLTVEITNTHEVTEDEPVTVTICVEKEWDDDDDADGLRPESVTVELYAGGVATGETVTLSEANGWLDAFTGLDAYDEDGNEVAYAIAEVDVPDGYAASYSGFTGSVEEGYSITVTNTHEVEAEEEEEATTETEATEDTTEEEAAEVPDTGDATTMTWAAPAVAGLAAVAGALVLRRRARR